MPSGCDLEGMGAVHGARLTSPGMDALRGSYLAAPTCTLIVFRAECQKSYKFRPYTPYFEHNAYLHFNTFTRLRAVEC